MTYLERLIEHSPWWTKPEWARDDRSLKNVRSSNFSFRHLSRKLRCPENLPPGSVSIIRGPRQVGKTTELKLLVEDLLSAGIPPRNIAYYPCDDIRNGDEITSPTMHHSFRPPLPDLKSQKYQNSLLFHQLL